MTYRRAVEADAGVIHALLAENAANDGGHFAGTEATLRQFGFGPDPKFRVVLAERGDDVLGLALFFPEYSSWRGGVGAFLQDLYVRPEARGMGLGRGILAAVQSDSSDWDSTFLTLMVHPANAGGRAFYAALGFRRRGEAEYMILEGSGLERLTSP